MFPIQKLKRNYTMTNPNDENHTLNGRCPNYALSWNIKQNNLHWRINDDYYIGNGNNINDGTKELREILSDRLAKGINTKNLLFCELDGVLSDFEKGVENTFNKNICELTQQKLWNSINKSSTFFESLPWTSKGKELWEEIKDYHPIIFTRVPPDYSNITEQKIRWCQRELFPDVRVITYLTKYKPNYCYDRTVLIDDRQDSIKDWENNGGKGILYDETNLKENLERIHSYMDDDISTS
jgi:hypothetical protein